MNGVWGPKWSLLQKRANIFQTAFSYGLGNADLSKIEVVDVR